MVEDKTLLSRFFNSFNVFLLIVITLLCIYPAHAWGDCLLPIQVSSISCCMAFHCLLDSLNLLFIVKAIVQRVCHPQSVFNIHWFGDVIWTDNKTPGPDAQGSDSAYCTYFNSSCGSIRTTLKTAITFCIYN